MSEDVPEMLLNASLAGYFVPFRSPQFKALANRRESLTFAAELWTRIFANIDPVLIVTIDQLTTRNIVRIVSASHGVPARQLFPTGWGTFAAELFSFDSVNGRRALLRLPHLSRFPIFGREASRKHAEHLIESVASHLRW
jgi:hypothetical protein